VGVVSASACHRAQLRAQLSVVDHALMRGGSTAAGVFNLANARAVFDGIRGIEPGTSNPQQNVMLARIRRSLRGPKGFEGKEQHFALGKHVPPIRELVLASRCG